MSTSGFIFIPNDNDPLTGTVVSVNFNADMLAQNLLRLISRDGFKKTADTLRRHEWRRIDPDEPEDDHLGTVGAVKGYGEYYNEPADALNITENVPSISLSQFRLIEPYVYVLHPDGAVTQA